MDAASRATVGAFVVFAEPAGGLLLPEAIFAMALLAGSPEAASAADSAGRLGPTTAKTDLSGERQR